MGIQDRDYYREHWKDLERANESVLSAGEGVANRDWLVRLLVMALACGCVYLGVQVVKLRRELAVAERVIHQQTTQMRADRERAARQRSPSVEFFNK